jgi:hypothetical protein
VQHELIHVFCVPADVPFEEGWRIEVKQRTGGSSAGTSDAVSCVRVAEIF